MARMRRFALVCLLSIAPASDAYAQAQGDAKKEAKEAKEKKEEKQEKEDAAVKADAAPEPHDLPTKPADPAKDRAQRRQRAISYARARWGALLLQSAAQAELRLHARRAARIDAMEAVAKSSGKNDLLPRIAKLREKETARFEQRMKAVREDDGKAGSK